MPESPKMGLFGSKDETKKETKDGSPEHYAPYSIDSDSETYDTEALSIMDINDIIGVQSEPVSDSTLESEIAALSQMITESKTDASQTGTEKKHSTKEKGAIENERTCTIDNSDGVGTVDRNKHSKSTLEELGNVHNADTEINSNIEQSSKETNEKQSFQLCNQQENNDTKDNCESKILSESITVMDNKVINDSKAINETVSENKEDVNISSVCKQENITTAVNSEVTIVGNKNSICGSLQLIGEAYSSEDSQEAALNNEEVKEPSLTTSSEKCLTPMEGNSNTNKIDELKDVSNIPEEISDVSSDVITMDKDVVIETIESKELCNFKVDSSSSYVKSEHAEELPIRSENTKDVPNKCEIDSPSNNVLQLEEKNVSIVTTDVKGILEGKEIDIQVTKETVTMESSEMEITEEDAKQADDICVTENESKVIEESKLEEDLKEGILEVNITEEKPEVVKDEIEESMVVKEKENHENEEKDAGKEDKENVSTLDSDQVLNAESNDKMNADNDAEVIEQHNEMETKSKQLEVHLENLKNSPSDLEKIDLLQVTDSSETAESCEVELAETKEDIEIEKLQSETKLEETSQIPVASNEQTSVEKPILQDEAELVSESGNSVDTMNLVEDGETDKEMKNEEENNLDSSTSEIINNEVAENVNAELCTIQTKAEEELKTNEESSEVVDKCKIPIEVDLNKDSANSMVEIEASDNVIDSTNIVATGDDYKNRLDQPLEEDTNKTTERIEVKHIETKKIENYIPEESIEKSEGTLNVSNNLTSTSIQLEDKKFSELYEDVTVEIQTKEKLEIIEKQVVEEEMKKEIEVEKIVEEQTKKGNTIEKQTEEDSKEKPCKNEKVEQLTETKNENSELENNENIVYLMEGNQLEQSEENVIQTEDTKMEETTHAVEGNAPDLKFINKGAFSSLQQFEMIIPEEEDHMEDEMTLTFEEENDSQVDTVKSDLEEKLENENVKDSTKFAEDQGDSIVKMDVDTSDSLNAEESSTIEINLHEVDNSRSNKNEILSDKQESEDNDSKSDTSKDISETANNINEMISEDQCQNTQDIVTSILDNESATDFKNILSTEEVATNEIEKALKQSEIPETELAELTEKLPQDSDDILNKDMEDSMSTQNIDSLEGLLCLDLIQEEEDPSMKVSKTELQNTESLSKEVDMSLLLEQSNNTSDIAQASDYISHVISSCLTDRDVVSLDDNVKKSDAIEEGKIEEANVNDILKVDEDIIPESINKVGNIEDLQKDLTESAEMPVNELDIDFVEAPLESDLEETESKLELTSDILLDNQGENLNDPPSGVETSQPSSEISELESAVKFLQESEEQTMDSPLVLSPKMVESVVDDISKEAVASTLFVSDEDMCDNTAELEAELQNIATDSIAISEAEIISEAVKLESERKLAEQIKTDALQEKFELDNDLIEKKISEESEAKFDVAPLENIEMQQVTSLEKSPESVITFSPSVLKISESIPKVSILEERLKEPPKIEIPSTDMTKVSISPTTSKDSLLIQKDAKLIAYQRMLESPKQSEKSEPKITETPRKDSEKHDFENVGSPRIILKIAKSAITDCGEPRSPKSPKIRSATNSPNPEDSPGQKLGKIKLKLSKSGHPSIISNENIEEAGQWYSEGSSSLSPMGMKLKLSKVGDASIISSERHESMDDLKEGKYRHEEMKRTESPIGMKIKLSKSGDASIVQQDSKEVQMKYKDKLDMVQGSPKRTESPIGMKIKLSKTGDASIIQPEKQDLPEEYKDNAQMKAKHEPCYDSPKKIDSPKRIDSPLGMKIKLSKTGDVSIVSPDLPEESREMSKAKEKLESPPEIVKRTESPIGMKIKLSKTKSGASIISVDNSEEQKDKLEISDVPKRTESPLGMKIKLSKTGDASIVHSEVSDETKEKVDVVHNTIKSLESPSGMKIKVIKLGETIAQEIGEESATTTQEAPRNESPIGMKIKLSKFGDASIVPSEKQEQSEENKVIQDVPKRTESPLGMKIKLLKTGDASIIQPEFSEENKTVQTSESEHCKVADASLGMKIKLLKTRDALDSEKKERTQRRRDTDSSLEMKIKISKTGHPTIVACDNQPEATYRPKETIEPQNFVQRYKEVGQASHKESGLKILKTSHSTILQSSRSEVTIEPVQVQGKKAENTVEMPSKRKDITISPIESKKLKLETQMNQMLPEVTIQPVTPREQKQFLFDPKSNSISPQQMNVINQEISITQVRPQKPVETTMSEKLKDILSKNSSSSPINSDCEIIEHRPELIIVNENSNSSQDVMIIEEVSSAIIPEVKMPKRRGRPRRTPLPQAVSHRSLMIPKDPLSLDDTSQIQQQPQISHFPESRENERPKRTCRSQKSYAPPRRSRGRGRGKRKMDAVDHQTAKKARIEQDLNAIEASTTAVITIDDSGMQQESFIKSPELYKVLKQPTMDSKIAGFSESADMQIEINKVPEIRLPKPNDVKDNKKSSDVERMQKTPTKMDSDNRNDKTPENTKSENKDMLVPPGHSNWLTPTSKRIVEGSTKHENVSTVQVIDEETRMSAESGSRSQTPARNISAPASETIINEESQGSVLSTATTESEKVKVKNRRMEINFDPDEGPFTVDKIAEYEWPLDRKGETFMIQEQISQYLGVKSFKRKYPDLKRRVVDMEERNYLRENALVSEAMCDMGLTAICSSEVLDVMCSDFPDQYEEYRKHMRERQVKEHSKKQKELTAAANAEKNRIDLAEMAVQSALSWNISLNKARRESRKCSLDLQTFTIHVPKKQQKVDTERRIGHYPVALIPGQYTDYYREYTPAELRYYPLNTVLYGPMRPNERKFDSQSEGSQSDSDSDSSSDDSSSSSSEGTQDTEGSQSTIDDVDMEINHKDEMKLKCKMCLKSLNKLSKNEVLIQCGTCNGHVHPSCIDLTLDMVPHIQSYAWQCTDCKTCAQCHDPADEDKMLFCDMCDRGYHIYCVGLRRVPQGRWHCQECAVCANCGSREAGGMNSDRNSVAQWQHEYKKGDKNTRIYVSTLCVPCSKLWRKGRYCPHCSRCHTAPRLDLEANLVHCSACDKYLHLGCVETKGIMLDRKNYLCDFCASNRQQVMKQFVSKTLRT